MATTTDSRASGISSVVFKTREKEEPDDEEQMEQFTETASPHAGDGSGTKKRWFCRPCSLIMLVCAPVSARAALCDFMGDEFAPIGRIPQLIWDFGHGHCTNYPYVDVCTMDLSNWSTNNDPSYFADSCARAGGVVYEVNYSLKCPQTLRDPDEQVDYYDEPDEYYQANITFNVNNNKTCASAKDCSIEDAYAAYRQMWPGMPSAECDLLTINIVGPGDTGAGSSAQRVSSTALVAAISVGVSSLVYVL